LSIQRKLYAAAVASNVETTELVIGLVAPMGTNTTDLANAVEASLSSFGYTTVVIKLSDLIPHSEEPVGERNLST
jgi:cytidine deaminase